MKRMILFVVFALLVCHGFAQSSSGISIKVFDTAGEGLVNWPVMVYQGGREVMKIYTGDAGAALAKPLAPNNYEVRVALENSTYRIKDILVGIDETVDVSVRFRKANPPFLCLDCGRLNHPPRQSGNSTFTAQQLEAMPVW